MSDYNLHKKINKDILIQLHVEKMGFIKRFTEIPAKKISLLDKNNLLNKNFTLTMHI